MTAVRVPAGAVLLAGDDVEVVRWALDLAQQHRRRNGLGPSRRVAELMRVLNVSGPVSESPQTDISTNATEQPSRMTITEAAAVLGVTERHTAD